jgi:hypothetical protein
MPVEENAVDTPEVEAPEVEVEETEVPEVPEEEAEEEEKPEKEKKEKKEKKPKPTPGKGRQDKGKGKALGKEGNMGKAWLETAGARFIKAGHSQRNVVVKAGKEAGMSGQEALQAFRSAEGTFEERIASLFD